MAILHLDCIFFSVFISYFMKQIPSPHIFAQKAELIAHMWALQQDKKDITHPHRFQGCLSSISSF
jgi:hypothetical protein